MGRIMEEPVQRLQSPRGGCEAASERPLKIHVPREDGSEHGQERWGTRHDRTPFTGWLFPGIASETSRRSLVARRRYIDVLSAVRCPRMSPMVFSEVPFFRRWTASECRRQCGP